MNSTMRWKVAGVPLLLSLFATLSSAPRGVMASDPVIAVVHTAPGGAQWAQVGVAVDARTGRTFAAANGNGVGQVTIIDATTGRVAHTLQTDQLIGGLDVDEQRGHAFVTTSGTAENPDQLGPVLMLDARTGVVLQYAMVGPNAASVAIDERRGRLFVLTCDAASTGHIVTIDTTTGRALHTATLGKIDAEAQAILGSALDATRGRLFVAIRDTQPSGAETAVLNVLDTGSGALVRTVALNLDEDALREIHIAVDERTGYAFADGPNGILALDATTGRAVRSFPAGSWVLDPRMGRVFVATPGHILTFDARTGRVLHATPVPDHASITDLALVPTTDRLLALSLRAMGADTTYSLSTVDATTGALVGTIRFVKNRDYAIRAVDARTSRVFLTTLGPHTTHKYTGRGAVTVVDGRTGRMRASVAVGENPQETVVDGRTGVAVVLDQDAGVVILLAGTFGATVTPNPGNTPPAQPTAAPTGSAFPRSISFVGHALVLDERTGRAFIAGQTGVGVLDTRTGTLVRTTTLGGRSGPLIVDVAAGRVYVALPATTPGAGDLVALDARTGALLRRWRIAGRPTVLALAARTGRLFVCTTDGATGMNRGISVLDTRRGMLRRVVEWAEADPADIAVDERTGRVFVAGLTTDAVSILDASSGTILRTTPVGNPPLIVAIAPDIGRVFVLDTGGVNILDAQTGACLRAVQYVFPPADITIDQARGRAFATDDQEVDPAMYILDARTGATLRKVGVDPSGTGMVPLGKPAIDEGRGRVYVLVASGQDHLGRPTGPGAIVALDAAPGRVRTRVALGDTVLGEPGERSDIVIDTRTQHLFALTDAHVVVLDTAHL